MYEPKTYKAMSSAKRAGKNKCLKNQWRSYIIYVAGDDIIMAAGPDERQQFEAWLREQQIPVGKDDISLHLVHQPHQPCPHLTIR